MRKLLPLLAAILCGLLVACGDATPVPAPATVNGTAGVQGAVALIRPKAAPGTTVTVHLELAQTEQERNVGLMNRKSLAPDAGMLFVFDNFGPNDAFYMKDTYVPLSIAFIDDAGTIIDIQDMQPLDETNHVAKGSYKTALEVNQGFFAKNGIVVGDHVETRL